MKSIASVPNGGWVALMSGLVALAVACFTPPAFAGEQSGSFGVAYAKRDVQPIAEGHILLLSESTGTNKGGDIDGFAVSVREIADLDKGNGPHSGYVIYTRGDDRQVVKFSGKVSTTLKDGQPSTTMVGNWEIVTATGSLAGARGQGAYSGYFTAGDKYRIDWKGSVTRRQAAAR